MKLSSVDNRWLLRPMAENFPTQPSASGRLPAELKACREAQAATISDSENAYLSGAIAALEWVIGETTIEPSRGAGL